MLRPNINNGRRGKTCWLRFAKFTQQNTPGKICLAKYAWQNTPGKIGLAKYAWQNAPGESRHVPPLFCTKRCFGFLLDMSDERCFIVVVYY
jgi:hypothetical protein